MKITRIDRDDKGRLDDIVIKDVDICHIEYMDYNSLWIGLSHKDFDDIIHLRIHSKSKIELSIEDDTVDYEHPFKK